MVVTAENILNCAWERRPIYHASKEGILEGRVVVVDVGNNKFEYGYLFHNSSYLPVTSVGQIKAGGYFTTYDEALLHMRRLIMAHIQQFNLMVDHTVSEVPKIKAE